MHLESNKENIIENFSIFFHKIIESRPNHEEHTKQFTVLKKYLLEDSQDFSKANNYVASLKERYNTKTSNIKKDSPSDLELKSFNPKKKTSPSSGITKFNQIPLKDFLIKNSITLAEDNKLCHRFSHIKEFLPDSQNFYRVLGLGVLEIYLTNDLYQDRFKKIYEDVTSHIIPLSMNVYPFTPVELRATFCGYLRQLVSLKEETSESKKLKELLFEMCHKDPVFDVALITFTKELIQTKISGNNLAPKDLTNRIKSSDSSLINDIIAIIPDALEINLIVEVVQDNKIKESIYPSRNPRENPNLNIIHEKQSSYQNFHLLSFEEQESYHEKESKTHSRHLSSANYPEKAHKITRTFGSDSKPQSAYEKNVTPNPSFGNNEHHYYQSKIGEPNLPRPTITIGEYNAPSFRTPNSTHGNVGIRATVDEKALLTENYEQKLVIDNKSTKNLHTPSKTHKAITIVDSNEEILKHKSNKKLKELGHSPSKPNLPLLEDTKNNMVTPNGKQKSPLNIYATLINGRSPKSDEGSYYSPTHSAKNKILSKSPTQVNQKFSFKSITDFQIQPVLTHTFTENKESEELRRKLAQPRITTMIPKTMETLPLNPFSTFSQQPTNEKYTVINPMSGHDLLIPTHHNQFEPVVERKTVNPLNDDKIYSTTHFGGSGMSHSFRRYTHSQNTYTGKSNNTYDVKTRKIV